MPIEACCCQNLKVRGATWAVASADLLLHRAVINSSKYRSLPNGSAHWEARRPVFRDAARVQRDTGLSDLAVAMRGRLDGRCRTARAI